VSLDHADCGLSPLRPPVHADRFNSRNTRKRAEPVTVCIAAMCQLEGRRQIVGAADRMITIGDVEYEPPTSKILPFGQSAVGMFSGDAGAHREIYGRAMERLGGASISVRSAVDAYCAELCAYHVRQGERRVLCPLGLTMDSFIDRQDRIGGKLSEQILYELSGLRKNLNIEAIIAGVDLRQPHIYKIDHLGAAVCYDTVGFAAVGSGARHAELHFMSQHHSPDNNLGAALLLALGAKRKAQMAPGVGLNTDTFVITVEGRVFAPIDQPMLSRMDELLNEVDTVQRGVNTQANNAAVDFFRRLTGVAALPQNPPASSSAETPSN
jgi:hypothetical protein